MMISVTPTMTSTKLTWSACHPSRYFGQQRKGGHQAGERGGEENADHQQGANARQRRGPRAAREDFNLCQDTPTPRAARGRLSGRKKSAQKTSTAVMAAATKKGP